MAELPVIHKFYLRVFLLWTRFLRRIQIEEVWVQSDQANCDSVFQGVPVLWISNHVSGWDGLILQLLSFKLLPRSPFYAVILASVWRENRWLRAVGTLPIDPQRPSSIRSTFQVLTRPSPTGHSPLSIAYFPQGKIWPSTRRPLGFKRGVEVLVRRHLSQPGAVVVPLGFHWEPSISLKPHLFVQIGKPIRKPASSTELESVIEALIDSILADRHLHGEVISPVWKRL